MKEFLIAEQGLISYPKLQKNEWGIIFKHSNSISQVGFFRVRQITMQSHFEILVSSLKQSKRFLSGTENETKLLKRWMLESSKIYSKDFVSLHVCVHLEFK